MGHIVGLQGRGLGLARQGCWASGTTPVTARLSVAQALRRRAGSPAGNRHRLDDSSLAPLSHRHRHTAIASSDDNHTHAMKTLDTPRLTLRPFTTADGCLLPNGQRGRDHLRLRAVPAFRPLEDALDKMHELPLADYATGYGRFVLRGRPRARVIGFSGLKYLSELDETELITACSLSSGAWASPPRRAMLPSASPRNWGWTTSSRSSTPTTRDPSAWPAAGPALARRHRPSGLDGAAFIHRYRRDFGRTEGAWCRDRPTAHRSRDGRARPGARAPPAAWAIGPASLCRRPFAWN